MTIENSSQEDLHIEDIHQLDKNVLHQSHQTHGVWFVLSTIFLLQKAFES